MTIKAGSLDSTEILNTWESNIDETIKELIHNVTAQCYHCTHFVADLTAITGQKAVKTKAKKSIANFKLREGNEVGAMVTLRGDIMYEFMDRLINVAFPRIKDFRGIKATGFDGHGNFSVGITEQLIFPEIDFDKITKIAGMNITFVTSANTDAEAKALLTKFNMPFRK